jgi:hypothetical protein
MTLPTDKSRGATRKALVPRRDLFLRATITELGTVIVAAVRITWCTVLEDLISYAAGHCAPILDEREHQDAQSEGSAEQSLRQRINVCEMLDNDPPADKEPSSPYSPDRPPHG